MGPWRWSVQPGGSRWLRGVVAEGYLGGGGGGVNLGVLPCPKVGGDKPRRRRHGWSNRRLGPLTATLHYPLEHRYGVPDPPVAVYRPKLFWCK